MRRVVMLMLATVLFPLMSCTVGRMDALYLATSTPRIQVLDPDTGEDSTSFNVLPPREASIPADSTTDFKVTFSPQETGSYNATINIRTDDPDTPLYTFSVKGEGQVPDPSAEAEINLRRGAVDIPSGTLGYDFTSVEANISDPPRVTFTIENRDENLLSVSGLSVDGDTVFTTIPDTLFTTLLARETYDFQIQFLPETNSTYSAMVNISNNDNDENPYTFRVDGKGVTGSVPDISVWSEGREVPDGTVYDFGHCHVGKNKSRSFIVKNLGTAYLQVSPPLIVAGKDFSQDMTSPAAVPPGGLHELTVAFQPGEIGTSTAKMLIRNNDADENPYIINLAGQGTD